jgi:copper transport protein
MYVDLARHRLNRPRAVWLAAAAVIALTLLLAARGIADAHAMLLSSEPAANSRLAASPSRVRLVFSEPVEPTLAAVSLISSDGDATRLTVTSDPHDVHAVIAPTTALPAGAYRVAWRVVSVDGHPVGGSFVFWVGTQSTQAPSNAPVGPSTTGWNAAVDGVPVIAALLRGLGLAALMAAAGLLFFIVLPEASQEARQRRVSIASRLMLAACVLLVLHLVAWAMHATADHELTADSLSLLFSTRVGEVELWRTGLAILALWAIWLARRPGLSLVLSVGALIASGAAGHSAAIHPIVTTPAKTVHLLAGAAWMGGLVTLLTRQSGDQQTLIAEGRRVSSVALGAVILVALSGLLQTFLFLPHPLDLFRSAYGAIILAKIAGLAVLVGFGAHHSYSVLPDLVSNAAMPLRFVKSLRTEAAIMLLVIMLGGWLAYLSPPHAAPSSSSLEHLSQ